MTLAFLSNRMNMLYDGTRDCYTPFSEIGFTGSFEDLKEKIQKSLDRYLPIFNQVNWRIQGEGGARVAPLGGPISFIFMQFSGKNYQIIAFHAHLRELAPPPRGNPRSQKYAAV